MPRGRKPAPKIQPALQGAPEKPKYLTGEASEEWDRLIPLLAQTGNLSLVERGSLEIYCLNYAKLLDCERHLAQEGLVINSPNGYPMPSAYVAIAKQAEKTMLLIASQFGFSPRSRKAVKQTEATKPKQSKYDFLKETA